MLENSLLHPEATPLLSEAEIEGAEINGFDVAGIIGYRFYQITQEIFMQYKDDLMVKEITYLAPAVWGSQGQGELSALQKEIHARLVPFINDLTDIFEAMQPNNLSKAQQYVTGYVIRELLISKLTYMIEMYKNQCVNKKVEEDPLLLLLKHVDTWGEA
jgi:hypothetical protein